MNEEKQRIAIVEFCGWEKVDTFPVGIGRWTHKDCPECNSGEAHSHSLDELPDIDDLNVINKACLTRVDGKMKLSQDQCRQFLTELSTICKRSTTFQPMIFASAEQRREALLKVIGKWEEDPINN